MKRFIVSHFIYFSEHILHCHFCFLYWRDCIEYCCLIRPLQGLRKTSTCCFCPIHSLGFCLFPPRWKLLIKRSDFILRFIEVSCHSLPHPRPFCPFNLRCLSHTRVPGAIRGAETRLQLSSSCQWCCNRFAAVRELSLVLKPDRSHPGAVRGADPWLQLSWSVPARPKRSPQSPKQLAIYSSQVAHPAHTPTWVIYVANQNDSGEVSYCSKPMLFLIVV